MRWQYWAAGAAGLLVPVVFMGGMFVAANIDPEWAHFTRHYIVVFELLNGLKRALVLGTFLATFLLWISVFVLALKAKRRSLAWTALAALGPLGLVGLALLRDSSAEPDAYERWRLGLSLPVLIVLELVFFYVVWDCAYRFVMLVENARVVLQSRATGVPVDQIVAVMNQSGGMWAFGEAIQQFFLIVAAYIARPVAFNLAAKLRRARAT